MNLRVGVCLKEASNALDNRCNPGGSVGPGAGQLVYPGRFHSYSAGAGHHRRSGSIDRGPAYRLTSLPKSGPCPAFRAWSVVFFNLLPPTLRRNVFPPGEGVRMSDCMVFLQAPGLESGPMVSGVSA